MKLRDKILQINDIKTQRVTVPAWGDVEVELRGLTGAERAAINAAATVTRVGDDGESRQIKDEAILYPAIIIAGTHDPESGDPVFGEADRDVLVSRNAGVLEDMALEILKISGISATESQVIRKNSSATPSDASPSA